MILYDGTGALLFRDVNQIVSMTSESNKDNAESQHLSILLYGYRRSTLLRVNQSSTDISSLKATTPLLSQTL